MNGKTKKIIQWTAGVIFSLLIIFVILISSFEIVLYSDMSVYRKEYEKYEVLDELDMTMDDAMYVTREMMDYLRGDKETLSVITEVEGKRQDFFNEQDRFHMREVRDIFAGSTATPSPSIFSENTASSTSSNGITSPSTGAYTSFDFIFSIFTFST